MLKRKAGKQKPIEQPFVRQVTPTGLNWELILCVFSLLGIGTVMVYSATTMFADNARYGVESTYFLVKHLQSIAIGLIACAIVYQVPMRVWFKLAPWIFAGALLLLAAVLVPGIGRVVNGSRRWIPLGVMNLQVTEVMKVAALFMAAWYTVSRQEYMHSFSKGFFPMAVMMTLLAGLIVKQPDLGALVVIVAELMGLLFLGGLSYWIFIVVLIVVVSFVGWMIVDTPWRMGRMLAYLNPWDPEYVLDKAYQLSHSLIAFGRGELFGVGLGGSVEKLYYLPEAHTDFIMAVVAEETGFVGVLLVLFLDYWLIRYAFEIGRVAIKMERFFSGMLAQGVGVWFGVQVFINVGVASGLLPTKGLTMPLLSFGGSALLSSLAAIGLLLRVDKENKILMLGGQV